MSITPQNNSQLSDIDSKKELIKRTFCKGGSDDELELFMHACKRTGLDPFMKQIYAIKRGNQMTIQTGIDGFRLIADRSGNYSPGKSASFELDDKGAVIAATAYLKKRTADNVWHEISATAYMDEYNAKQGLWAKMPRTMLAKCAEALALRKAFPAELSGLYTNDEMDQSTPISNEPESITEEQCAQLDELILEMNNESHIVKLCGFLKVHNIYEMHPRDFDRTIRSLERQISIQREAKLSSDDISHVG